MTQQCDRQASGRSHASSVKLKILHNQNGKEYEEMVIEEAEAEGWKSSPMRATKLSSFRASRRPILSKHQAYRLKNEKKQGSKDKRREVGEGERVRKTEEEEKEEEDELTT